MLTDSRKNLQFSYNFLNLLGEVKSGSTVKAKYTWLADGSKLRVRDNSTTGFDYLGSLTYTSSSSGLQLETAQFAGGVIRSGNSQEINYFITDHLGSVRSIVNSAGTAVEQNDYYAFGAKHVRSNYAQNSNRFDYNGKEEQTTGNLKYLDYGARMYDNTIGRWFNVDPLADLYYQYSPYNYTLNNPVRYIDPDGTWVPGADGHLMMEDGDDIHSLAAFLGVNYEFAFDLLMAANFINSDGDFTMLAGDILNLDNPFTRNLEKHKDLKYGDLELFYNCWGSALAGVEGKKIKNGKGIGSPKEFDRRLERKYESADPSEAKFGATVIRFSTDNPYSDPESKTAVEAGLVSLDPKSKGGSLHGAVYYGTSKDGTVYVYTKDGWYAPPKIIKLENMHPGYGKPIGYGDTTGYYNLKKK